jgi:4-hydroxy-tetrahydrodipicolinate synthase
MRRMVDEPENRAEIEASLKPVFDALGITTNPIPVKAALALVGRPVGGLRLPLVEADDAERAVVRAALEGVGLL